nr:ATP synthase F0 subunit 8 [Philus pallescens]
MPQMAPLNWIILMFMFIMIFKLFNCLNYFSFFYYPSTKTTILKKKSPFNWKW